MTTKITRLPASHVDHGLTEEQLDWILDKALLSGAYADGLYDRVGKGYLDNPHPVSLTFELPEALGTVPCGLHGPEMGDEPVPEDECRREARGDRSYESRLTDRPARQVRAVSLITCPHEGEPLALYTAFGGPVTPREPLDPSLAGEVECPECRGRGWTGTLAIPGPGGHGATPCYPCGGGGKVRDPELARCEAFWAKHALSGA